MLASGRMATVASYDVEDFPRSCVLKYCELAKFCCSFFANKYNTPFRPNDYSRPIAGRKVKVPLRSALGVTTMLVRRRLLHGLR